MRCGKSKVTTSRNSRAVAGRKSHLLSLGASTCWSFFSSKCAYSCTHFALGFLPSILVFLVHSFLHPFASSPLSASQPVGFVLTAPYASSNHLLPNYLAGYKYLLHLPCSRRRRRLPSPRSAIRTKGASHFI